MTTKRPDIIPSESDPAFIRGDLAHLAVSLEGLNLDPENARVHGARNLGAIAQSLRRFGQYRPIVVQEEGMIVRAGNGTVMAARSLGWKRIAAVIVPESEVEATAFAIADNRTFDLSRWDEAMLALSLSASSASGRIGSTAWGSASRRS